MLSDTQKFKFLKFKVLSQKIWVTLSYCEGTLTGKTEIQLLTQGSLEYSPRQQQHLRLLAPTPQSVFRLQCKAMRINSALINGIPVSFHQKNVLEQVVPSSTSVEKSFTQFFKSLRSAQQVADDGELFVSYTGPLDGESITITLNYTTLLHHCFTLHHLNGSPYLLALKNSREATRSFCPLFEDNPGLAFPTPTTLCVNLLRDLDDNRIIDLSRVLASGTLLSHSESTAMLTFSYSTTSYLRNIGLAIGPFVSLVDAVFTDKPRVSAYASYCPCSSRNTEEEAMLKRLEKRLEFSTLHTYQAFLFFKNYLKADFPYPEYSQVFIPEPYLDDVCSFANICLYSSDLLLTGKSNGELLDIEAGIRTRRLLGLGILRQWFGGNIHLNGTKKQDFWIYLGAFTYVYSLFIGEIFGNSARQMFIIEQGQKAYSDDWLYPIYNNEPTKEFVAAGDSLEDLEAIDHTGFAEDMMDTSIYRARCFVTFHILEGRIGAPSLQNLIVNICSSSRRKNLGIEEEMGYSTQDVFKFLQGVILHKDAKTFMEQWVFGRGLPPLKIGFWFNRKRHHTEFAFKQILDGRPQNEKKSNSFTLRIHELKGTFDEIINLDSEYLKLDIIAHSRSRKGKKHKLKSEDGHDIDVSTLDIALDVPLLWLRFDPKWEQLRKTEMNFPEWNWIGQLYLDRNVKAQYEAIQGLKNYNTTKAILALEETFSDPAVFYMIRVQAGYALASIASPTNYYEGLAVLLRYILNHYYFVDHASIGKNNQNQEPARVKKKPKKQKNKAIEGDPATISFLKNFDINMYQLKPNSFDNFEEFFIQREIPLILSTIGRNQVKGTPLIVIQLLLDLLNNNNNSQNQYSDASYITNMIAALGKCELRLKNAEITEALIKKIIKQLDRYLKMEKFLPSPQFQIASACIKTYSLLMQAGRMNPNVDFFKKHLYSEQTTNSVRLAAAKGLCRVLLSKYPNVALPQILHFFETLHSIRLLVRFAQYLDSPKLDLHKMRKECLLKNPENIEFHQRFWTLLNSQKVSLESPLRLWLLSFYYRVYGYDSPQFEDQRKMPSLPLKINLNLLAHSGSEKKEKRIKDKRDKKRHRKRKRKPLKSDSDPTSKSKPSPMETPSSTP